jgi:putative NIF3 family GTP cyclohydrolase 1 type 2
MKGPQVSRRMFVLAAAGMAGGNIQFVRGGTLVARDVVARIHANVGVPIPNNAIDGFKAGNPDIAVKGIATTAMATMEVLRQAAKRGLNLVITYENVYFAQEPAMMLSTSGKSDSPRSGSAREESQQPLFPNDPAYKAKKEFIENNGMAVYRFHDQWTARRDNPMAIGLGEALGWSRYHVAGDPTSYQIPSIKFESLVDDIRKRLNMRAGIRVVGDRHALIQKVAVVPGSITIETGIKRLPEADLLITGQSQEWDVTEYAFDAAIGGWKKGYIMLGVVVSEDPGMRACANWIKSAVKNVPVEWIGTGDPYWRPA